MSRVKVKDGGKLLSNIAVDPETGCWNWTAARNDQGYGCVMRQGRLKRAHRVSYEENVGPIPDGMSVLHKCDNPPCINPQHLFVGTHADNVADMIAKGRRANRIGHSQNVGTENGRAKLTEADIEAIRSTTRTTQRDLAERYGVSRSQISQIRSRKYWTSAP